MLELRKRWCRHQLLQEIPTRTACASASGYIDTCIERYKALDRGHMSHQCWGVQLQKMCSLHPLWALNRGRFASNTDAECIPPGADLRISAVGAKKDRTAGIIVNKSCTIGFGCDKADRSAAGSPWVGGWAKSLRMCGIQRASLVLSCDHM